MGRFCGAFARCGPRPWQLSALRSEVRLRFIPHLVVAGFISLVSVPPGRKLDHCAAPPLLTATALLGCGGVPVWVLAQHRSQTGQHRVSGEGGVRMPPPAQDGHKPPYNAKQGCCLGALRCEPSNRVMQLVLGRVRLWRRAGNRFGMAAVIYLLPLAGTPALRHPVPVGGAAAGRKYLPPDMLAGSCRGCCPSTSSCAGRSIGCAPR